MASMAYQYSAMQWLDDNLPAKSFLISEFRSNALLPRPFLASSYQLLIPEYQQQIAKNSEGCFWYGKLLFSQSWENWSKTSTVWIYETDTSSGASSVCFRKKKSV